MASAWYAANRVAIQARDRDKYRRVKSTPKHKAARKSYYLRNKERIKASCRAHWLAKRGTTTYRAAKLAYYEANKPDILRKMMEHKHRLRMDWDAAYREKARDRGFKNGNGGTSRADAALHVASQNGQCYLCGKPEDRSRLSGRLQVDHCHATGRFRAMLCCRCNRTLGHVRDDPSLLRAMADYLELFAPPR